jgi:hypothetical protein
VRRFIAAFPVIFECGDSSPLFLLFPRSLTGDGIVWPQN